MPKECIVVICRHCLDSEYEEEMRWLNGRAYCRNCYLPQYETINKKKYIWSDLDGPRPTKGESQNANVF